MHTDAGNSAAAGWAAQIVASAQARGVPVVSGRQMLEWLDSRNAATYSGLSWQSGELAFEIVQPVAARNLQGMLPTLSSEGTLASLTRDGQPVSFTTSVIKGVEYALFAAEPGAWIASYQPDGAPPVLSNVTGAALSPTTALVSWTSDEPASSQLSWGTSPGALTSSASSPGFVTAHAVSLTGLPPGTTIYFRVSSADAGANTATSPAAPAAPASFSTPNGACLEDAATADFAAGEAAAGTFLVQGAGGGVALAPTEGSEFTGAALPSGWSSAAWAGGGSAIVAGGALTLDGARAGSDLVYAAGRSLEFTATFAAAAFQHVGFGVSYEGAPWAIFSTGSDGATLKARSNGASASETSLGSAPLGSSHRYRIDWSASDVAYRIDGVLVATHAIAVAGPLRPLASDGDVAGPVLSVSALSMTPYAPAGSFTSRVADAGLAASWGAVNWTSALPAGASVSLFVRSGPSAAPDGTWTAFSPIASSGDSAGQVGRYAQYRAELATSDLAETPVLQSVTLACTPAFVCGDGVLGGSEQCDDGDTDNGDGCSSTCAFEGADADGDGILNVYETGTGIYVSPTDTGSDPLDADSDGDGAPDGPEVAAGTDPNDPLEFPPIAVGALDAGLRVLLAGLLLLSGRFALRRRA
jgi:cysteine-rich repeat protein